MHQAQKNNSNVRTLPAAPLQAHWLAPLFSHLRIDVDPSFSEVIDYCRVGGVVRNHEDQWIQAFQK